MPVARFIISIFVTLTLTATHGQSTEELISNIRTEFKRINTEAKLRTIELNNEEFLEQMTDGGGQLTGYLEDNQLVKFKEWVGLSIGNVESEYYFKKGELFFIYQQENRFANKEDGEVGDIDYSRQEVIFEGRYYLNQGQLIKELEKGDRFFSRDFEVSRTLKHAKKNIQLLTNDG